MKVYCVLILIFLFSYPYAKDNFFFKPQKELRKETKIFQNLPPLTRDRLFSLLFGEKRGLKSQDKKAFEGLGLFHLLTPSGLHYSLITKVPRFFINVKVFLFLSLFIYIILKIYEKYSAISRVVLFSVFSLSFKKYKFISKRSEISFVCAFFTDLMLSSFSSSGLSILMSFLFWGTILVTSKKKYLCIYLLFCNQILVSVFMQSELNFVSLLANPFLTFLFLIYYPLLIINSVFHYFIYQDKLLIILTNSFFDSVQFINNIFSFLIFKPSFELYFLLIFFLLFHSYKKTLLCCLLLFSLNTGKKNKKYQIAKSTKTSTHTLPPKGLFAKKYFKNGYKFKYRNGRCRFTLRDFYWEMKCYKKSPDRIGAKSLLHFHI